MPFFGAVGPFARDFRIFGNENLDSKTKIPGTGYDRSVPRIRSTEVGMAFASDRASLDAFLHRQNRC